MEQKVELVICLGSSCFSRGNKITVKVIDEWLKEKRLRDKVFYHGNHCFSNCDRGPILKIADKVYEHVDTEMAIRLLTDYFKV
jgi:NADH:ubiquinone oxidoreductase subunit E